MAFDPLQEVLDARVSTRNIFLPAVEAPRHEPSEHKRSVVSRAHQRRAAVVRARVETLFATCADEALVQTKASAESVLLELPLTSSVLDDRDFHELQPVSGRRLLIHLPPASHRAVCTDAKHFVVVGKTNWRNVDLRLERTLPLQDGDVVVQAARVKMRMRDDLSNLSVVVRRELERVASVPLASSDEIIRWIDFRALQAVIGCESCLWVDWKRK